MKRLLIVGNPNVGKSVLFNRLTGRYVTVSNYPGTTVEVTRGKMTVKSETFEVIDTPGMYSLRSLSEEEQVAKEILLSARRDLVLHVIDAKNLERMLPFTLQLIEAGFRLVLALNMMDEADRIGLRIDFRRLAGELGIPVLPTVAVAGAGIDELRLQLYDQALA